jgi:phage terminase small subunit
MSILKNQKHELFCQLIVEGKGIGDAYTLAGYEGAGAYQSGSQLLRKPKISARIEEMKANIVQAQEIRVGVSKGWVIEELQKVYKLSSKAGQFTPANKSLELLGKELGMFKERIEHSNPDGTGILTGVTVRYVEPKAE